MLGERSSDALRTRTRTGVVAGLLVLGTGCGADGPEEPLAPEPSLCEELDPQRTYEGLFRAQEDGALRLWASRAASTCAEEVGCADEVNGDYLKLILPRKLGEVGGYSIPPLDDDPDDGDLEAECGGCSLFDGNGVTSGDSPVGGHLEITRFDSDRIEGCVLGDTFCEEIRFRATRCD